MRDISTLTLTFSSCNRSDLERMTRLVRDALVGPQVLMSSEISMAVAGMKIPPQEILESRVDVLKLGKVASKALAEDNIVYIGDLIRKTETEMLRTPYFGPAALNEVVSALAALDCRLGTHLPDWPPEYLE